jgi:CelD/BcsL family acetyltransferase involved in cellulose biosynthesis
MLSIYEVSADAEVAALRAPWEALHAGAADPTPFQSWEWVSAWWTHLGRGRPRILVAREGDVTVGVCPLVLTRYRGAPLRQLRFMGAPQSDFQDAIVLRGREHECATAFLSHLAHTRDRWDVADLNDLRDSGPVVAAARNGGGGLQPMSAELEFHRHCPVIRLTPTWEAFAAKLGKNLRQNVGRRQRQLEKAFAAELCTADAASLPSAMEALFRLHNARWRRRGALGAFSGARLQAFHHEVARRFLERGWLRLHLLRAGGEVRAAFYCFQLGRRVYYYLSGFDAALGKYSPGNVLMAHALRRAIADGADEFDLLRGDETYKYTWQAEDRVTLRLVLGHGGVRSRLARLGHRFERFVEHEGLRWQRRLWGDDRDARPGGGRDPARDLPGDRANVS